METIGWIGSLLFAICGLPQAVKSYKDGHSEGVSSLFLIIWLGGEVFTLTYILDKGGLAPLVFNYLGNLIFILIILKYKFFPRR